MSRPGVVPLMVGVLAALVLLGASVLIPTEVRHSAPFGFRLTFDADRGIAVSGGLVASNYPNFNRIDLDLRAYEVEADYDLTVHVRPDAAGAADVRTISLSIPGSRTRHDKPTFADPFTTLRFSPIADSVGQRYYVWIERGPRNRDDVVALWSIKSYSRVTGRDVLAAFLRPSGGELWGPATRALLAALLVGTVVLFGWLMTTLTARSLGDRRPPHDRVSVAASEGGWYTLDPLTRRSRRRVITFRSGRVRIADS